MPANAVWTPPADWAVNEVATAAKLNQQLRDNLAYLKGVLDGVSLQDVVLARNLTVIGSLSARPYVFDVWPDANNLTIRPPGAGYLNITSPINIELFTNAYKAGDGNWYRFDTTKGGFAVRLLADYRLVLQTFGAGTGAITPTGILTLFPSGGVSIGPSPSDPGAGNLRVEEQIIATRVGIGLASPAYPLDVAGDVRWSGTLQGGTVPPARISPQGPGSGLDADMVDGQHAAAFALAGHTHPGVVRAVNNAAGPFTQRDIWQDLVTVTITPGAASGVFLVIGNTYFTGDDPIKLKLVVGAAATPDNAYVYNGYGGKTAWAIGTFTNNTTSPVTVKFQGMIVGGTGTDQFEQSFLTVLWLP